MKATEAKDLSSEELNTLKSLFERWMLRTYPHCGDVTEDSAVYDSYIIIEKDAKTGSTRKWTERTLALIQKYGECET
jgi:hypothetical protein